MSAITTKKPDVFYPESDGKPMADNTEQFQWIVTIQGGLDALFRDNADVFVAGDLLWYPVEGDANTWTAPDALVVFGRPKGFRGSYQQWREGNVAPQVVFEVLSPSNRPNDLVREYQFYDRFGVEEYYLYDPDRGHLVGWQRQGNEMGEIPQMQGWVSPRLGVRFEMAGGELRLIKPNGERFATYVELEAMREKAEHERDEAIREVEQLKTRLRELGKNPDEQNGAGQAEE